MERPKSCDACLYEKYEETKQGVISFCKLNVNIMTGSGNHDRMMERHPDCPLDHY